MAVEFGIIRAKNDGFGAHDTAEMFDLFLAVEEKVSRVFGRALAGKIGAIGFFVGGLARDAVVFEAGKFAQAVGLDVRANVVVIEVEAAVAIKVAVFAIAGVALLCAPDLFTGFDIATKGGGPGRGKDGGEDALGGPRIGVEDSVGVDDEPANFCFGEVAFDPGRVGTFWQPDAPRVAAKAVAIILAGDLDLRTNGLRKFLHEGKKAVGGAAGNNFEDACILKFTKSGQEVALVTVGEKMTAVVQAVVIEAGEGLKGGVVAGAVEFFRGEFDLFFEAVEVAVLEERIAEHGAEGWSDGHGQAKVNLIADEPFHHIEEGKISFGDGLVEPVLF